MRGNAVKDFLVATVARRWDFDGPSTELGIADKHHALASVATTRTHELPDEDP